MRKSGRIGGEQRKRTYCKESNKHALQTAREGEGGRGKSESGSLRKTSIKLKKTKNATLRRSKVIRF